MVNKDLNAWTSKYYFSSVVNIIPKVLHEVEYFQQKPI